MEKKIVGVSFMLLVVVFFAASCGAKKSSDQQEETQEQVTEDQGMDMDMQPTDGVEESAEDSSDQAAMLYHCPMKCDGDRKYAEAGKCESCGMDLVKVNAEEESASQSGS